MRRLIVKAPAKVNLFLDVLGKRADGYHELQSLVLPVALFDRISLETAPAGIETIAADRVYFPGIPWPCSMGAPEDNLITRAAKLLKKTAGYRGGARIRVAKRIPIGGGMGGGSSDAAAVLNGLNRLWRTGLSTEDLMALGARLGCDIPAFVHGGILELGGRGERIRPVRLAAAPLPWLLLVNPGISISTGDIYARYKPGLTSKPPAARFRRLLSGLERGVPGCLSGGLFNALQGTVYRKYPLLAMIHNALEQAGAEGVLLSGSGSTVFALVKNRVEGERLAGRIRAALDCPLWTRMVQAMGAGWLRRDRPPPPPGRVSRLGRAGGDSVGSLVRGR